MESNSENDEWQMSPAQFVLSLIRLELEAELIYCFLCSFWQLFHCRCHIQMNLSSFCDGQINFLVCLGAFSTLTQYEPPLKHHHTTTTTTHSTYHRIACKPTMSFRGYTEMELVVESVAYRFNCGAVRISMDAYNKAIYSDMLLINFCCSVVPSFCRQSLTLSFIVIAVLIRRNCSLLPLHPYYCAVICVLFV